MKTIWAWILGSLFAANCSAATYYIDFAAGSDSNDGTAKTTPWQHHPFMTNWSGTYAHSAGDQFIFKGGVTWDNSCFGGSLGPGMNVASGGSAAGNDYYGVDLTWYVGGSWTQPCFDGGYVAAQLIRIYGTSYLTIDNLELKRVLCTSNYGQGCIVGGTQSSVLIENCYIHGWQLVSSVTADDAHGGIILMYGGGANITGVTVNACTLTNIENANGGANGQSCQNGVALRQVGTISNCTIHDVATAVLFVANFNNNHVNNVSYPLSANASFDPTNHANGIYLDTGNGSVATIYCYDNYVSNTGGGANTLYPNPYNKTIYIYNNLLYGNQSVQLPINIDTYDYGAGTGGNVYCYNNTIVNYNSGSPSIRVAPPAANRPILDMLTMVNNQVIYTKGGSLSNAVQGTNVMTLTQSNNLVESAATAAVLGYTLSNLYAPAYSNDPTVDAGVSESDIFAADILGVPRPQGRRWDIGAYELRSGSPPLPVPVVNSTPSASGTVGTAFSYNIAGTIIPDSFDATALPAGLTVDTSTGAITGTPTTVGTTSVTISATNVSGTGFATLIINIEPPAPLIQSVLTASGTVGSPFNYTIMGSNSPTIYSAMSLPAGLSLNTTTGSINGVPSAAGLVDVTISAANGGGTGSATLAITISAAQMAPIVTSSSTAFGTVGSPFSYTITGSNSPIDFSAMSLPAGLSLNANNGTISGAPIASGTTNILIGASNSYGTGTGTLLIFVSSASSMASTGKSASWLANLSARGFVKGGQKSIIAGFATSGNSPKSFLIRGIGPTLSKFDLSNFLTDPRLTLFDSTGAPLMSSTSWDPRLLSDFQRIGAFPLTPGSNDAAFVQSIIPGAYSAEVDSATSDGGVALAEIYDMIPGDATDRLVNMSARAVVGPNGNDLIAGFVIGGSTLETLLIRADGPGLKAFGVTSFLPDPVLTLYDSSGRIIVSVVGWGDTSTNTQGPGLDLSSGMSISDATTSIFDSVGAFSLASDSADSASLVALPPGAYTAEVTDRNGGTGVGLVEIYEVE